MSKLALATILSVFSPILTEIGLIIAAFTISKVAGNLLLFGSLCKTASSILAHSLLNQEKKQQKITAEIQQILNETGVREH